MMATRKVREPMIYGRVLDSSPKEKMKHRAPKGYIPVLVGKESMLERFLVHVNLLNDPCIAALLEMTADELGYRQQGPLRILCDADHFREVVNVISKGK